MSSPAGAPLQVLSTSITGPDAADLILNYDYLAPSYPGTNIFLCYPNTPNNSCSLGLQFSSTTTGLEVATLTIITSAGTATVPLIGNQPIEAAAVRAAPVNVSAAVGTVAVYDEAIYQVGTEKQSYTFANPPIVGPNATDFSLGILSCGQSNIRCTLPILFVPGASGPRTTSLVLLTGATQLLIPLNGTGQ